MLLPIGGSDTLFFFLFTSVTGWLLTIVLVATIIYPFLLRGGWLGPVQPFLKRMRLHYWLGFGIIMLVLVHSWVSMSAGLASRVNALGLDLATIAMFLIFGQGILGVNLRDPKLSGRRTVRRWHFWLMVAIVLPTAAHIVLDSATIAALFLH
jgi:hypothetical protein